MQASRRRKPGRLAVGYLLICVGDLPPDVFATAVLSAVLVNAGALIAIIKASGGDHVLGDTLTERAREKGEQQLAPTQVPSWASDTQHARQPWT
ncbi:MAG: hypothetical protein WAK55_05955 [Xanthobacteraceae bacterium]